MIKDYYLKIVDTGLRGGLSETHRRQIRSTNTAALLGIIMLVSWIPFAFIYSIGIISNIVNITGALLLLPVFYFNKNGRSAMAAIWLLVSIYVLTLANLYLYGYESGVPLIFVILIPLPFLTIPVQLKKWAVAFSLLCGITWILIVSANTYFPSHLEGADTQTNLRLNVSFIAILLSVLFYSLSNTINRAEKFLQAEREKSDTLLHNILPHFIVSRLKERQGLIADGIPMASVLFADLVGFTSLSEKLTPVQLVKQLNEVFSEFDGLSEKYRLEKIKTIGDAYMVSGGLQQQSSDHLENMARMALDMLAVIRQRNSSAADSLQIRIGIHIGPVVAGVIGTRKFAYDIWGDTVNLASRMESHGLPGKIHVSEQVKVLLAEQFSFAFRGAIEMKGKGLVNTYFLDELTGS